MNEHKKIWHDCTFHLWVGGIEVFIQNDPLDQGTVRMEYKYEETYSQGQEDHESLQPVAMEEEQENTSVIQNQVLPPTQCFIVSFL